MSEVLIDEYYQEKEWRKREQRREGCKLCRGQGHLRKELYADGPTVMVECDHVESKVDVPLESG